MPKLIWDMFVLGRDKYDARWHAKDRVCLFERQRQGNSRSVELAKSPPTKQIVADKRYEALVGKGDWEMILNVMVWSEGPAWWQDKLVFSDTRLEKIYSWDPKTKFTDIVLEKAGYG